MTKVPPPDDQLKRDALYDDEFEDDGLEYELEPIDPEILASQQRIAEAEVVRAETRVAIAKVEAEAEQKEPFAEFFQDFQFRFQVKHLLMATAGLAIFASLSQLLNSGFAAFMMLVLVLLIAAHSYLAWRDRQREERLAAKREQLVQLARKKSKASDDAVLDGADEVEDLDDEPGPTRAPRPPIRISFSMKEVMIAMTVGAVVLGLLQLMPAGVLSAMLGLAAVAGLAAYAAGIEMKPQAVLGWWVILVLYLVVSFAGSFFEKA